MADEDPRRELAELRRRAYGRDADIQADPDALARLTELEERLRPPVLPHLSSRPESRARQDDSSPAPAEALPAHAQASAPAEPAPAVPAPDRPARRRRPGWRSIVLASVVAIAVLIGGSIVVGSVQPPPPTAPGAASPSATPAPPHEVTAFTDAADTRLLYRIPLDRSVGPHIDLPASHPPSFPTDSGLVWANPLGGFYGTQLWIARTESDRACLLVDLGVRTHASCIDPALFDASALLVTVPFFELDRAERPDGMRRTESLGFWWVPGGHVDVLVGPTPGIGG